MNYLVHVLGKHLLNNGCVKEERSEKRNKNRHRFGALCHICTKKNHILLVQLLKSQMYIGDEKAHRRTSSFQQLN